MPKRSNCTGLARVSGRQARVQQFAPAAKFDDDVTISEQRNRAIPCRRPVLAVTAPRQGSSRCQMRSAQISRPSFCSKLAHLPAWPAPDGELFAGHIGLGVARTSRLRCRHRRRPPPRRRPLVAAQKAPRAIPSTDGLGDRWRVVVQLPFDAALRRNQQPARIAGERIVCAWHLRNCLTRNGASIVIAMSVGSNAGRATAACTGSGNAAIGARVDGADGEFGDVRADFGDNAGAPDRSLRHSGVDCQQRTGAMVGGIGGQMHAAGGEIVVRGQLPRHGCRRPTSTQLR
jgi:hypothetical protein